MRSVKSRLELLFSALMLAGAIWALSPASGAAEPPCEYEGYPGIGGCTDGDGVGHFYGGQCEGIDCYYELEACCAKVY